MLANALNLFDSNCKQTAILEICRDRKNKWAIAPELQNRSLWVSLGVFDTSGSVNTALRGADRVYLQHFDAEWCQTIVATSVGAAPGYDRVQDLGDLVDEDHDLRLEHLAGAARRSTARSPFVLSYECAHH